MKKLAPNITRQRLVLEGFYNVTITKEVLNDFLIELAEYLHLRTYGDAVIFSPGGEGKAENQGFDAFIPLIDSGISAYIWSKDKFFSIILYTCKAFDSRKAEQFTKNFFAVKDDAHFDSVEF